MLQATFVFILGTLLFSALLTPVACSILIAIFGELLWPFSRVYDRVALAVAIGMLLLLRKKIDLSAVKSYLQSGNWAERGRYLLFGMLCSIVFVMPILPLVVDGASLSWRSDETVAYYIAKAGKAVLAGLVISLIEEGFFRVVIFQNLKRYLNIYFSALVCAVLYAVVHFIRPDKSFSYDTFSLVSGFEYTWVVIQSALFLKFLPAFFGLVVVGLILCFVIQKTRSLYLCIGLHSGWVIAMKMTHYGTDIVPGSALEALGTRRYDLVSQPEVWFSLALTFTVLYFLSPRLSSAAAAEQRG